MTLNKNKKGGFSLVEFLIVVGILAILAVIVVPLTIGILDKSNTEDDKVTAGAYTEYMQRFALEKAGDASFYGSLSNDGAGSEYELLANNSGKGSFPGITALDNRINSADTEEEVWSQIRKEACIAIKAYSDKEVITKDGKYYVNKPHDENKAFVYYYLTGKIELKEISSLTSMDVSKLEEGSVDTEDYWVFLDRDGGSGKAYMQGSDFYVKVVMYGAPDIVINGATVQLDQGMGGIKSAITAEAGMIVFRNVQRQFVVSATKEGALPFADEEHYGEEYYSLGYLRPEVSLDTMTGVGTFNNPYVIALKVGTLGSLELRETVVTYKHMAGTDGEFKPSTRPIADYNKFVTSFEGARPTQYTSDTTSRYNPLKLMGYDLNEDEYKTLMLGQYNMLIQNITNSPITGQPNFLDYSQAITSNTYGLYGTEKPEDEYLIDASSPYTYSVVLTRNDTIITGKIVSENAKQPLHGAVADYLLPSTNYADKVPSTKGTVTVTSYVYAVCKDDPNKTFCSEILTPNGQHADGSYIYDYELVLKGQHSGEIYELFLVTEYGTLQGTTKQMQVSKWPKEIEAVGCTYILQTNDSEYVKINVQSDVSTAENSPVNFKVVNMVNGVEAPLSYTMTLTRLGYGAGEYPVQVEFGKASNEGIVTFKETKKGFYKVDIDYDDVYPYENETHYVFIDEGDYVIVRSSAHWYRYVIECRPSSKGTIMQFNGRNILAEFSLGDVHADAIKFLVKIDDRPIIDELGGTASAALVKVENRPPEKGEYRVNFSKSENLVTIEFWYEATTESLTVNQSVDCFDKTNVLSINDDNGFIPSGPLEFIVNRLEDEKTSEEEHTKNAWQRVSLNASKHAEVCSHCGAMRAESNHFVYEDPVSGLEYESEKYYGKFLNSDNNSVSKQHYHLCTFCGYSTMENCTPSSGKPTASFNLSQKVDGTPYVDGYYSLSLKDVSLGTISKTYHYQYCTDCNGRAVAQDHKNYTPPKHNSYESGTYKYQDLGSTKHAPCNTCDWREREGSSNHIWDATASYAKMYDKYGNETTNVAEVTYVHTRFKCSICGHVEEFNSVSTLHGTHITNKRCDMWHIKVDIGYQSCASVKDSAGNIIDSCWTCGSTNSATCEYDGTTFSYIKGSNGNWTSGTITFSGTLPSNGKVNDVKKHDFAASCITCQNCGYSRASLWNKVGTLNVESMNSLQDSGKKPISEKLTSKWCYFHGNDTGIKWAGTITGTDEYGNVIYANGHYTSDDYATAGQAEVTANLNCKFCASVGITSAMDYGCTLDNYPNVTFKGKKCGDPDCRTYRHCRNINCPGAQYIQDICCFNGDKSIWEEIDKDMAKICSCGSQMHFTGSCTKIVETSTYNIKLHCINGNCQNSIGHASSPSTPTVDKCTRCGKKMLRCPTCNVKHCRICQACLLIQ